MNKKVKRFLIKIALGHTLMTALIFYFSVQFPTVETRPILRLCLWLSTILAVSSILFLITAEKEDTE